MELIAELIFGLIALLFYKAYRLRHPELLGKPAKELALTFAKLQLINNPRAFRSLLISPLLPAILIIAGVIMKTEIPLVILIAAGVWFLELLGLIKFAIPLLKFSAIVDRNQVAMEEYFSENKAAVIALALKDPEVISAHKKLGEFFVSRAIKNVRTEMYPGF